MCALQLCEGQRVLFTQPLVRALQLDQLLVQGAVLLRDGAELPAQLRHPFLQPALRCDELLVVLVEKDEVHLGAVFGRRKLLLRLVLCVM